MSCPSPVALERAFWSREDALVLAHAQTCPRCRAELDQIRALAQLCAAAPEPLPDPARTEALRTAVLACADPPEGPLGHRGPLRAWAAAAAAAAAAIALVWVQLARAPSAPPSPPSASHTGPSLTSESPGPTPEAVSPPPKTALKVRPADGARFERQSHGTQDVLRLDDGAVTLEVPQLSASTRFLVRTADAEIEAADARLEVQAARGRLTSVRLLAGRAQLHRAGETAALEVGVTWLAPPPPEAAPAPEAEPAPRPRRRPRRIAPATTAPSAPSTVAAPPPPSAYAQAWDSLREGAFADAARGFEKVAALSEAPAEVEDARYFAAVAWGRAGHPDRARRRLEDFMEAHPSSVRAGEAAAMLGWLCYERADYLDARAWFERAANSAAEAARKSGQEGLRRLGPTLGPDAPAPTGRSPRP